MPTIPHIGSFPPSSPGLLWRRRPRATFAEVLALPAARLAPGHENAELGSPAFAHLLRAAFERQGVGRHIVGDHAARADISAGADAHGRDERRVRADEGAGPDLRGVLAVSVIVAEDRAGADVGAVADAPVTQIGEVVRLRSGAERDVLDLDKVTDVHAGT